MDGFDKNGQEELRELRTEYGWPIVTKTTGKPDLPVGTYLLESTRQSPEHDRIIPDPVRGCVLFRDNYTCVRCKWNKSLWDRSDPRYLELHHVKEHAKGGKNIKPVKYGDCCILSDGGNDGEEKKLIIDCGSDNGDSGLLFTNAHKNPQRFCNYGVCTPNCIHVNLSYTVIV
ncbi:MAG: hypothetical protein M0T74_14585 [Desulfitobacterium hafniense]|nr:hypothetical protein [Desulfitobacterium hafniense]